MSDWLDDIFNDDKFGLLNQNLKHNTVKTDTDRLVHAFEEINFFYEKNKREPENGNMSEYNLSARLKGFRNNEANKKVLKPYDRYNLLGDVAMAPQSFDEIMANDTHGLLNAEGDLSIFEFKHTPKPEKRAETDFVAKRTAIADKDFDSYETLFIKVHQELKAGIRKLLPADNTEKNIQIGNFYLLDGLVLYVESGDLKKERKDNKSGARLRVDGRLTIIFENGTKSNMLFRSLGKALQKGGRLITQTDENILYQMQQNTGYVAEYDLQTGWIYVLKSHSKNPKLVNLPNLYKIGYCTIKVADRIKNAAKEATYLYSDVEIMATYRCYDLQLQTFESLMHRFFAHNCLNVDIYDKDGKRFTPREWFVVPLPIINEAINMLINGSIINYVFDNQTQKIILK
jgi:hypothetical protein